LDHRSAEEIAYRLCVLIRNRHFDELEQLEQRLISEFKRHAMDERERCVEAVRVKDPTLALELYDGFEASYPKPFRKPSGLSLTDFS
jgi:hypothetical protein